MAATRDKYKPPQIAERWFNPLTTCSIVSFLVGTICSTLGEMTTYPNGELYGDKALKALVRKAWTAVDPEHDDRGFGLSDFNTFAKAWGSPLRKGDIEFVEDKADIIEQWRRNNVVTMAGNVKGVPDPTPLDDHVGGANHRMAFKGFRTRNGVKQTRFFDPMTLDGNVNWGRWVPVSDVFAFGSKFRVNGKYLAERFITGHYTREAKARRAAAKSVLQVQRRVVDLQGELIEANETIARKQARLLVTSTELAACQEGGIDRSEAYLRILDIENAAQDLKDLITVSPTR